MIIKIAKNFALPVLTLIWIITFCAFFEREFPLAYECHNENPLLNNNGIVIINSLPFIAITLIMILTILFLKINNKILFYEIACVMFFGFLGIILTVACYYDIKDMFDRIEFGNYQMIEAVLYGVPIALVVLSGIVRYSLAIKNYVNNKRDGEKNTANNT